MQVIGAVELRERLPWTALADALADAVRDGGIRSPDRHVHELARGTDDSDSLLVMPAWTEASGVDGLIGVKTVTFVPSNAARDLPSIHATYLAFDRETGEVLALIDGEELTARRTAALAALAARILARAGSRSLLVVGTGSLALPMIEAHRAILPGLTEVWVWGRRRAAAEAVCAAAADRGISVRVVDDLEPAARDADVIVSVTAATSPLLSGSSLSPGAHVGLIGAFRPDMREADEAVMRQGSVFVDVLPGALHSGDLAQLDDPTALVRGDLAGLVRHACRGRSSAEEITIFESVGFAAADLVAARLALGC